MALYDEFREEREQIKKGPFSKKLAYFWDYYKWHTIIGVALIIGITSFIYNLVTKTDPALSGIMLNAYTKDVDVVNNLVNEYVELQDIDTSKYHVSFNTGLSYTMKDDGSSTQLNYSTDQVITARHMADDLDFVTGDIETMKRYAYRGLFGDLRDFLSEEQLVFYEPYLLYYDMDVVRQIQEASDNLESTDHIVYPDCDKPEDMKDPIPAMIDLSSCEKLTALYAYEEISSSLTFGICTNVVNPENTVIFLEYVMGNIEK